MALPSPRPDLLQLSPLAFVVCQLRYESQPEVADSGFIRRFHGALGGAAGRYPQVERSVVEEVTISDGGASKSQREGWNLRSADRVWAISILPDFASIETTGYVDWDDFRAQLVDLLAAVEAELDPALEIRLGLRYVDRLVGGAAPADWVGKVRSDLLGPVTHPDLGPLVDFIEQRVRLTLPSGNTCLLRHGYAPDDGQPQYVLDFDVFREQQSLYNPESVRSGIDSLHDDCLTMFQQSLVETYWDALRRGEDS